MIIVAGQMTMTPSCLDDFERDVAAMIDNVRAEDGCSGYSLLVEDAAKGLVHVFEQWRDDAALAKHFTMPWIQNFFSIYGPHLKSSTVKVYDVASVRDLPS